VLANIEGTALSYTENAAATAITAAITVSDADSANMASGSVQMLRSELDSLVLLRSDAHYVDSWLGTTLPFSVLLSGTEGEHHWEEFQVSRCNSHLPSVRFQITRYRALLAVPSLAIKPTIPVS
jgi:hypothetical protein